MSHCPVPTTVAASLAAIALGLSAAAHPPQRGPEPAAPRIRATFDHATGRDLRNYPPHRTADIEHIALDLTIADMDQPVIEAVQAIRFRPIASPLGILALDADGLSILSVACPSRTVRFVAIPTDQKVEFIFEPPLPPGEPAELRIEYRVTDPAEGVIWVPTSPAWPGRLPSLHTQGEPESNRCWFFCRDFPNERLSSEVTITVPDGYTAISNGRLVSRNPVSAPASPTPAQRFHYVQSAEHAPYLVSLAVGRYDVVDVGTSALPMPVYVAPGQASRVRAVFDRTPSMLALYEQLFDEPYPWDKYAQVVVNNFAWGGMENTSNTHLYDSVVLDQTALLDGDEDALICHELAHQWFGNLLTCRSWEHIWLNEAWATYTEALWSQYGASAPAHAQSSSSWNAGLRADDDAYFAAIWSNFQDVIDHDRADAPFQPAMVSKEYGHPEEVFDRAANPYPKGAAILHMLRERLGDDTFFAATAEYLDRHRNQPVETFHFRRVLEAVSGLTLQRFFDQWCERPGVPHLDITAAWNPDLSTLDFTLRQTQNIDGDNPAFAFDLPITLTVGGRPVTDTEFIETREHSWSIPCTAEPSMVCVNPRLTVLAEIRFVQPTTRWITQLTAGPTLAARLQSAEHLAAIAAPECVAALADTATTPTTHRDLRIAALNSLATLAAPPDPSAHGSETVASARTILRARSSRDFPDARVRKAWLNALALAAANAPSDFRTEAADTLARMWRSDPSYAVRAAALTALADISAPSAAELAVEGLRTDSQHDQIRQAAIEALATLDQPGALATILPFAAPGHPPGTRQAAITAMVELAPQSPDRVLNVLAAIVHQAEVRTRRAALEALLALNDPRARPLVVQFAESTRSRADRIFASTLIRNHDLTEAAAAKPE